MSEEKYDYLQWAHPLVREWFKARFGTPTLPQEQAWPSIIAGQNTLVSAPTGSGKTLAAFLVCIDKLVRQAVVGADCPLLDRTEVVYISPLKALSNDIKINLEQPLAEIYALAAKQNKVLKPINIAVRTGDTLAAQRQAMLRKPPHILVTTPESFYLMLTAEKSRQLLRTVHTVIVDEIHAVADDKRGSHLSISIERLQHLTNKPLLRIGLSATQNPIELVGQFLVGNKRPLPAIINTGHTRKIDIAVEVPNSPLEAVASNDVWEEIYDRLQQLIELHRATLIFVNTRKQAERITMNLAKRLGEEFVATHHGSLSRKIRLEAENKLKNGEIKALVATASLELGIDIGFIDLVCQMGSPRSIAAGLQRVGRAGHWLAAIPKGRFFATTRDELLELAALSHAITSGDLDKLIIPDKPLDILAQQIVAMCVVEDWQINQLFKLIKKSYSYRDLSKKEFAAVVDMLSEGIAARRGRYGSYLFYDRVNGKLKKRRNARLVAVTSGGAIPESNLYQVVVQPDGTNIGTLDEDFAIECNRGDIILLGNSSWRIRRVENAAGRVSVEDAHGAPPTVPFWLGEAPGRSAELSNQLSRLRQQLDKQILEKSLNEAIDWLKNAYSVDQSGAEQIIEYIVEGKKILGVVPSHSLVVAERFFDEGGGMQLIIHAPFGGRINKAWGLALRKKFCRTFNFELQAAATDNGLNISLGEQHSFPLADVFYYLTRENLKHTLEQAVLASPIFATRWRWDAIRSLALPRFMGGKKVPPYIQRLKSDDLLAAVFPAAAACGDNQEGDIELPEHPLVEETMKDALTEALDWQGLRTIIEAINTGEIKCQAIDTPVPSLFAHEILNANPYAFLDDAPLEERRARAVEMRRILPDTVVNEIGSLDTQAIDTVRQQTWPDLRDADELHDFLQTVIVLPENLELLPYRPMSTPQDWWSLLSQLKNERRADFVNIEEQNLWLCAEKANYFQLAYPTAQIPKKLAVLPMAAIDQSQAILSIVQGWLNYCGPISNSQLANLLKLPAPAVEMALLQLESSGAILRGKFVPDHSNGNSIDEWQWCDRRLLARIHRLTLATIRKQIEPISASIFMRWLSHWQHIAPKSQLTGEHGLLSVLGQLQGFEIAANAWEKEIFAKRVSNYDPDWLDRLCLTGQIGWGRLSVPKAFKDSGNGHKRIVPTSVAPITFFVRKDSDWMMSHKAERENSKNTLSSTANTVKTFLQQRGASFFADIVRGTGLLKAEIENALWELVTAGIVTADGFDNLRALINPKRRAGQGAARNIRPRHSLGRWSLLYTEETPDINKAIEAACKVLLKRYGVVFRDLLTRESLAFTWRQILMAFRSMEARGEIYGGTFVGGFLGEQFALPEALESLRSFRQRPVSAEPLLLSAADPLNLIGIIVPGNKVPSVSHKWIQAEG